MATDDVDLAIAAYREEGVWHMVELDPVLVDDAEDLADALTRWPAESGVIAMVSVNDEFFVIARLVGQCLRLLLSDVTAVLDWPLATSVADLLDVPDPDDDDEPQPAGDMEIVADLGVSAIDIAVLLDDSDLYPDEMLGAIATRLGFGDQFEAIAG